MPNPITHGIVSRPCQYTVYDSANGKYVRCGVEVRVIAAAPHAFCRNHTRLMMREGRTFSVKQKRA